MSDTKPITLSKNELLEMADIMSNAFISHENWVERIKKDAKRKKILNDLFLVMFGVINRYGYIFVVSKENKNIGYITYMDPADKAQISLLRIIRTGGLIPAIRFLIRLNISILKHMSNYMKVYNSHTHHIEKLSIHLYSTGIKEEYRGKGIMGHALRESFEYFYNQGYKMIELETSDKSNIPIYQKLGFKIEEVISKKDQTIYFFELEQQVEE